MPFNTALSGLRASSSELNILGNNIANASTTAFKASRAEFADVYATSILGGGSNSVGSGVLLSNVSQQFTQGNISFTNNSLDMAVNGAGFFIMSANGAQTYTRAGELKLDKDGYMVNNDGSRLQGFQASATGAIAGNLSDLQIVTDNLQPQLTTEVDVLVNVDASETVLATRGTTAVSLGADVGVPLAAANNAYASEVITVNDNGSIASITSGANATAAATATQISTLSGASATASTTALLSGINDNSGNLAVTVNGVTLSSVVPATMAAEITSLTNSTLPGITATEAGGIITIVSSTGANLDISINNTTDALDTVNVTGTDAAGPTVLNLDGNGPFQAVVGGTVTVTLNEGVTISSDGSGAELFADPIVATSFITNAYDASNPDTYNHATSVTIYDSLGNSHVLSMFYVKETALNTWTMYARIDDEDIGDPNIALPSPQNIAPTVAQYNLVFNNDGTINNTSSDTVLISYFNPKDSTGVNNGSMTGITVANGGTTPIPDPATSSNFVIDMNATTQYGSPFSVNALSQNGYTTGRLSGVDVSDTGVMFARYTNGQSRTLGQVALANFANQQGLGPDGGTAWVESFTSGQAIIGTPGSASLGAIQSGALEESNVDLSEELVNLIIAQRNFQANAKTIQTADAVTQTIINLR